MELIHEYNREYEKFETDKQNTLNELEGDINNKSPNYNFNLFSNFDSDNTFNRLSIPYSYNESDSSYYSKSFESDSNFTI